MQRGGRIKRLVFPRFSRQVLLKHGAIYNIPEADLVFRAFFDESGTDRRKNKAFVIGGFLGRIEEWLKASDAWEESLHKHPRIEYFKHSEYQSLGGQFVRFNRQQAENKIVSLASTIANVDLHGFCSIAPHRIIESKPVEKGLLGSRIYDWAFGGVIKLVLEHM